MIPHQGGRYDQSRTVLLEGLATLGTIRLVESTNDHFDLRRLGAEIAHCRVQALVPHDIFDQSRIPRLRHCHRTKRVAGAVQLQGIWDSETAGTEVVQPRRHLRHLCEAIALRIEESGQPLRSKFGNSLANPEDSRSKKRLSSSVK